MLGVVLCPEGSLCSSKKSSEKDLAAWLLLPAGRLIVDPDSLRAAGRLSCNTAPCCGRAGRRTTGQMQKGETARGAVITTPTSDPAH